MISSLISFHLKKQGRQYRSINPPYVPIFFFLAGEPKVRLIGAVFKNFVLGIADVDDQRRVAKVDPISIILLTRQVSSFLFFQVQGSG